MPRQNSIIQQGKQIYDILSYFQVLVGRMIQEATDLYSGLKNIQEFMENINLNR